METRKLNSEFSFVNTYGSTRNGFFHRSELVQNGVAIHSFRCSYLNRTWERYPFQTSMRCCLADLISEISKEILHAYRKANNVTRLSSSLKEQLISSNADIITYNELLKTL